MAFNTQEQEIIRAGVQSGKSKDEILGALTKYRTGVVPEQKQPTQTGGFGATLRDIPSDVIQTFGGAVESVTKGMETASDVRRRVEMGETTPLAGTLQTIGGGLRAGAEIIGQGILGLGKTLLSPKREEQVAETVASGVERIAQTQPVQEISQRYSELSPEQQRNIQGALGAGEGLATTFGFAPIVSKLRGTLSESAVRALEASDDVLRRTRESVSKVSPEVPKLSNGVVQDIRFALSDIDPQVETILQRSDFNEVNRYFQQARTAKADPAKNTPLELAGTKAVEAFDSIDKARKSAITGKKAILESVANERVSGNTINEVMSTGIQRMSERFGASIDAKGNVTQAKGRTLKLDASDEKLVREYFTRLNALGIAPTVQQVDDFVDWAQGQLYKQSKTMSKFEVASEPVIRELQGVTGDLNTRLKDTVGGGYGEVNARIGKLIELQEELSNALGADARKGGGLMKRLFSPTGGDTRRIFEEIRQETGIDLVKEATLARFAMEGVGDVRQRSLLQSLGVIEDTLNVDITKPGTWLKAIREYGDLDAQELANEVIRRASSSRNP